MTDETKIIPLDTAPELPKDLQAQAYTIRAFAQTFNMLQDGLFPTTHFGAVQSCLSFLKEVHLQAVTKASEHAQADLVPELKTFKEQQALAEKKSLEGAENGQV
jgi:hypothetical protein